MIQRSQTVQRIDSLRKIRASQDDAPTTQPGFAARRPRRKPCYDSIVEMKGEIAKRQALVRSIVVEGVSVIARHFEIIDHNGESVEMLDNEFYFFRKG